jgi:hypothetical protein
LISIEEGKEIKEKLEYLEKQLAYLLPDSPYYIRDFNRTIFDIDISEPSEKENFIHEYHLRYVVLLNEINTLKDMFKILKPVDPAPDIIKPERIPNFAQYVPYTTRLAQIDEKLTKLVDLDAITDI